MFGYNALDMSFTLAPASWMAMFQGRVGAGPWLSELEVAMTAEPQRRLSGAGVRREEPTVVPFTPLFELEHLLKVSGSVAQDANQTWAEMWAELRRMTTGSGMISPEANKGFVPTCGWPEFLEKFWLLKHYLDSIQRICEGKH
jgi:hypothetical protein